MQGVKEKKAGISEEGVTDKNKNNKKSQKRANSCCPVMLSDRFQTDRKVNKKDRVRGE